jgi:hypothetical protein
MDDTEVRLACLGMAVSNAGNPNHVQKAREYYAFVTESEAVEIDKSAP